MIVDITKKSLISDIILNKLLEEDCFKNSDKVFYVEHYENGREKGYAFTNKVKKVCFSEHRNTDQIVLYFGEWNDFKTLIYDENSWDFRMNVPSEDVYWKSCYYFKQTEVKEVVELIIKLFIA